MTAQTKSTEHFKVNICIEICIADICSTGMCHARDYVTVPQGPILSSFVSERPLFPSGLTFSIFQAFALRKKKWEGVRIKTMVVSCAFFLLA